MKQTPCLYLQWLQQQQPFALGAGNALQPEMLLLPLQLLLWLLLQLLLQLSLLPWLSLQLLRLRLPLLLLPLPRLLLTNGME